MSDDELTSLALEAEAHDPFEFGTRPYEAHRAIGADLLPDWYMPAPQLSAADRTPRRTLVVGLVVVALVLLNGAGLCVTYGVPEIAW